MKSCSFRRRWRGTSRRSAGRTSTRPSGASENGGTVRGSDGDTHAKLDGGGPLRAYYERLLCPHGAPAGLTLTKNARADDGSTIALEYSLVRAHGRGMPSQVGLAVYERGESGLLRTVRIYDDVAV